MTHNLYHYGVVVGINTYPGGLKPLSGAVNDARAFTEWLTDPKQGGVPQENVKEILTPEPPPVQRATAMPTKTLVDDAIWNARELLANDLQKAPEEDRAELRRRSRLYLFVAGHGIMPGGGLAALLDAKAVPGYQTNLELQSYQQWLVEDGQFAEVCIFADCCRNYELLAERGAPPFDRPSGVGNKVMYLLALATTAGGMSFEDIDESIPVDERRGYFSRALIEGLRGNAADPDTGLVTSQLLKAYVDKFVREWTTGRPPRFQQEVDGHQSLDKLVFGPPRGPRTRRKVIIRFPAGLQGQVELVAPDGSMRMWDPADGPLTDWLYDGTWYVQRAGTVMDTQGFAGGGLFLVTGEGCDVQL